MPTFRTIRSLDHYSKMKNRPPSIVKRGKKTNKDLRKLRLLYLKQRRNNPNNYNMFEKYPPLPPNAVVAQPTSNVLMAAQQNALIAPIQQGSGGINAMNMYTGIIGSSSGTFINTSANSTALTNTMIGTTQNISLHSNGLGGFYLTLEQFMDAEAEENFFKGMTDEEIEAVRESRRVISWERFVGRALKFVDGSKLRVDHNGNYTIEDKDAKIIYKACNVREFNRFMNASDQIEEFIKDLGLVGVTQDKVLKIPIEAFINWLVIKASEADQMPVPEGVSKPEPKKLMAEMEGSPRCLCCGRFLSRSKIINKINFCSGAHMDMYLERSEYVHN